MDPRVEHLWSAEFAERGALVRPARRADSAARLLGAVVGVAVGLGATLQGHLVIGVPVLAVGAVAAAVFVHRLVTRRPVLRVDPAGVAVGRARVPWTDVAGIEVRLLLRTQTVVVLVGPEGRAALDAGQSRGGRLLRTVRGGSVWGLPTGQGLPTAVFAHWLTSRWLDAVAR